METKVRMINRVTGVAGDVDANEAAEALVAQGGAEYEEITRGGFAFHCQDTAGTAQVIALPTTTAGIGFYNTAADGGKSAIVDAIFGICVTHAAAQSQDGLIYVLGQTRVATLTSDLTVRRNNGNGATTDNVLIAEAGGAILDAVTGVAIGWFPISNSVVTAVTTLGGQGIFAKVDGRIIIPPGRALGINVLGSAVAGTWNLGMMWHEKQITLA